MGRGHNANACRVRLMRVPLLYLCLGLASVDLIQNQSRAGEVIVDGVTLHSEQQELSPFCRSAIEGLIKEREDWKNSTGGVYDDSDHPIVSRAYQRRHYEEMVTGKTEHIREMCADILQTSRGQEQDRCPRQSVSDELLIDGLRNTCPETLIQFYAESCRSGGRTEHFQFQRLRGATCAPNSRAYTACWVKDNRNVVLTHLQEKVQARIEEGDMESIKCLDEFVERNFDEQVSSCVRRKLGEFVGDDWVSATGKPGGQKAFADEIIERKIAPDFMEYGRKTLSQLDEKYSGLPALSDKINRLLGSIWSAGGAWSADRYGEYATYLKGYCDRMVTHFGNPDGIRSRARFRDDIQSEDARRLLGTVYGADEADRTWKKLSVREQDILLRASDGIIIEYCKSAMTSLLKAAEGAKNYTLTDTQRNEHIRFSGNTDYGRCSPR